RCLPYRERLRYHHRRPRRHRLVVSCEALRFTGVIRLQIRSPSVAHGLETELGVDTIWALRFSDCHGVPHAVTAGGEIGVLGGIAVDCDVAHGLLFIEPVWEQPIVL